MIGASKILTVSYGTFSCTLEGFDEPFGTMKAIAEYFRDLAADDRYFGAEPPIPDAAMLHRIAEREIHRRVEAKVQDNGVILRAGNAVSQDSLPAPTAAPAAMRQPTSEGSAPAAAPVESVAAKLMRIRAAAFAADTGPAPDASAMVGPAPEPTPDMLTVSAALLEADQGDDDTRDEAPDGLPALQADDAEGLQDAVADDAAEDWLDEPVAEAGRFAALSADEGDAEPEQAFLQDGHDDVGHDDVGQEDGGLADHELNIDSAPVAELAVADLATETAAPVAEAAHAIDAPQLDTADHDDLDIDDSGVDLTLDAVAPVAPMRLTDLFPEDDLPEDDFPDGDLSEAGPSEVALSDDGPADAPVQTILAGPWHDAGDDDLDLDDAPEASVAVAKPEEEDDDLAAALAEEPLVLAEPVAVPADTLPAPAEPVAELPRYSGAMEKIERARARIIKIHRAIAPDAVPPATPPTPATGLTAEAGAILARALADERKAAIESLPAPILPSRPVRRLAAVDAAEPVVDASVNRLLAQTATEMDVPEQRRRRSAIEHLKAAVAATIADRRVGGPLPPSEDELADPYRSDLSEMVGTGSAAPVARSTPLVLVSEQRIDRLPVQADADAQRGAVLPRRVGTAPLALRDIVMDEDDADDDEEDDHQPVDPRGFAEFAARLGAQSLPDLLEAAAAYTAIVEGRPHFSRPHLMRQVATVITDLDFTRETGLRGFGTLLRTGRILRVKRGQYALAEGSRYLTDMAGE